MFATIILAALAAGTPFLTPGTYRYTALLRGQTTATSTLVVKRDSAGTKIEEKTSGTLEGIPASGEATLALGTDLAPTQYDGTYQTGTQNVTVAAALTSSSGTVISSLAGGQSKAVELVAGTRHFAVLEPGLMAGLFALPAQIETWKDSAVTLVVPVTAQAETLAPSDSASPPPRPAAVPAQDRELSFGGQVPFTIWYDPTTFVPDEVDVPSQKATIRRVGQ